MPRKPKRPVIVETYVKLLRAIPMPPAVLLRLKRAGFADYIPKLNTSLADAEFGPGWLDQ